jgi:hypothetical protein
MLIFQKESGYYIFIHIPKNSGKYIRNKLTIDKNNKIIKSYWDIEAKFDLAHIPYVLRHKFIEKNIEYNYFTYTRNPYDRIISAFFYKNPKKKINDFINFVKNNLILYDFNMEFNKDIIHYYPQYLFICDENLIIPKQIEILKLENVEKPKKYDLPNYFDNECIAIINKIYIKDFTLLDYQLISML